MKLSKFSKNLCRSYAASTLEDSKARGYITKSSTLTSSSTLILSVVTNQILDNAAQKTLEEIRSYCRMENHRPFTMNVAEYLKAKEERVTAFALDRHKNAPLPSTNGGTFRLEDTSGASRVFSANEDTLLRVLSSYGIHLSSSKELVRIHADENDAELGVISHVVAYFDISSKRLIDDIPKVFETMFARDFGVELRQVLTTNLKLVGAPGLDNCQRYIRDEPDVQAMRNNLTRQQDILVKALDTVSRFFK